MNNYITGKIIKELREKQQLTQMELANILNVSDKTISRDVFSTYFVILINNLLHLKII